VLGPAVVEWVVGPLARRVLALATAPSRDGGSGAYFLQLRRA
jgi:hypothetical protein